MPPPGRKPTLSPTRIQTYIDCAMLYRYTYIMNVARFHWVPQPGISYGSTLHAVLQQFHGEGGNQSAEEMITALDANWVNAGYATEDQAREYRQAAEVAIQAYHGAHNARAERAETIALERNISCDLGRFRLLGRVDRIDRWPDGTLEIIDYKSGTRDYEPADVTRSLAMRCYQLIATETYPGKPVVCTLYSLGSGVSATAALDGQELATFRADITALGGEILDRDFNEVHPVPLEICPDCNLLSRCQRIWNQQERAGIDADPPGVDDIGDEPHGTDL